MKNQSRSRNQSHTHRNYKDVYDGYKLVELYDNDTLLVSFTWQPESVGGLDVPVSMTYAGNTYSYVTDGNKNVTALLDAAGFRGAGYTYGPFGQVLSMDGALAEVNPFRFSSEFHDDEIGLVYYNYRYYSPSLGRWSKRDPIEEEGGVNVYGMCNNDVITGIDSKGLDKLVVELHFKCINNCIRAVNVKAIFIDEKWFGEDERIHIPGNFELRDSDLYFKSGEYIITGRELASLVDEKKYSTSEQWTTGIRNLVTKENKILHGVQRYMDWAERDLQVDLYKKARRREDSKKLLDSVADNYRVGVITSVAGAIPLGKIISLGDALSVIDTGKSIVQEALSAQITVPGVGVKGCGDLADVRRILIISHPNFFRAS